MFRGHGASVCSLLPSVSERRAGSEKEMWGREEEGDRANGGKGAQPRNPMTQGAQELTAFPELEIT